MIWFRNLENNNWSIFNQEGSRELEAELETQLEQSEKKCKEFRLFNSRLTAETEQLRDKLEQAQREHHCQVSNNVDNFVTCNK